MGSDLKARLRAKFTRRSSTAGSVPSSVHSETHQSQRELGSSNKSIASTDNRSRPASVKAGSRQHATSDTPSQNGEEHAPGATRSTSTAGTTASAALTEAGEAGEPGGQPPDGPAPFATAGRDEAHSAAAQAPASTSSSEALGNDLRPGGTATGTGTANNLPSINEDLLVTSPETGVQPIASLTNDSINPPSAPLEHAAALSSDAESIADHQTEISPTRDRVTSSAGPHLQASSPSASLLRPSGPPRRQSLLSNRQNSLIKTLWDSEQGQQPGFANPEGFMPINVNMVTRKIWVRRPSASATLITVNEDDLVDDVREMILRKYTNSLGRQYDAPDLTLRICPREQQQNRMLGPEEPMGRTLDAYFPGGQSVDEALIIDIPTRRTPRPSPRVAGSHHGANVYYTAQDVQPPENGEGYFPPLNSMPSPSLPVPVVSQVNGIATHAAQNAHGAHSVHAANAPHSIAVLGTGQIPPIPSPGGTRSRAYRDRPDRPRLGRTHTSSPTLLNNASSQPVTAPASHAQHTFHPQMPPTRTHSNTSDQAGMPPPPPPVSSSPSAPEAPPIQRVSTPPPKLSSPRTASSRPKNKKKNVDHPVLPSGMLSGGVPPINVLIVEDNPINLKLLEAFVKRLKVRWKTAMNGKDAVKKWKSGGFHLVLMDIQLPVMNGLDATREIRRLERVNSIGVFSSSANSEPEITNGEVDEQDRLSNIEMFKSPVIIVALTASSLQSDRHDALAAGCNDFLTKPVNFVWLERKVMEWGCMQALIDFDGWRQWKDFSQEEEAERKTSAAKAKSKKNRLSMATAAA